MTTATLGDALLDELLGLRPQAPPSVSVRKGDHPLTEGVWALHWHAQQHAPAAALFPTVLVTQEVEHRGVIHRFLLLGLRMSSRVARPTMMRVPTTSDGDTWGAVVLLDGRDLLDQPERWSIGEEGRRAAFVRFNRTTSGLSVTQTVALAVTAEPMTIERHVVDRDGQRVPGSSEAWMVEGGDVNRIG